MTKLKPGQEVWYWQRVRGKTTPDRMKVVVQSISEDGKTAVVAYPQPEVSFLSERVPLKVYELPVTRLKEK